MTHLPYNTDFPTPGTTLTAAQANALPVGSVVRHRDKENGDKETHYERTEAGWDAPWGESRSPLALDGHTLLRVGPAPQYVVGQVVTREELDALPDGAVASFTHCDVMWTLTKQGPYWEDYNKKQYSAASLAVSGFEVRIVSLPSASPACPHAEGTWDWAVYQMDRGHVVKSDPYTWQRKRNGAHQSWVRGEWADEQYGVLEDFFTATNWCICDDPAVTIQCPHAVGTLAWARWKAEHEGACVAAECSMPWKFSDGRFSYWDGDEWVPKTNGDKYVLDWLPTGWSIVPDPSLPAETPVADVLQIDPAEIAATLDEAIPEWRDGMTVAQAVGELNLRIGLYQASDKELREKVEALTAERDGLRIALDKQHEDYIAERDSARRLRAEAVDLHVEIELAKSATDNLAHKLTATEAERDAALARAEKAEATEREWMAKGSQIDADMDDLREQVQEWKMKAEKAEAVVAERLDASTYKDEAMAWRATCERNHPIISRLAGGAHKDDLISWAVDELVATKERAEKAEQLLALRHAAWKPRVVVPDWLRKWAAYMVATRADHDAEKRAAEFILSLTADHSPEAGKIAPFTSAHPEGSREWAEDMMRAGFSVTHDAESEKKCVPYSMFNGEILDRDNMDELWETGPIIKTGWRIHQPAVAPGPLEDVDTWIQSHYKEPEPLTLESIDERLTAVETRLANGEVRV